MLFQNAILKEMVLLPGQSPDILSHVSLHSDGHFFSHNCPKNPSGQPSLQLTPYFPGVHSIKKNIYTFVWGFLLSVHVHVNWLTIFRKPL